MPSRRRRDGSFHDVAHPINQDLREHIESTVLDLTSVSPVVLRAGDQAAADLLRLLPDPRGTRA